MSKNNEHNEDEEIVFEPGSIPSDRDEDEDGLEFEDDGSTEKDKIKKLKEEMKTLKKERQEYLDGWQRARAEYANLKKDSEDGRGKMIEILKMDMLEKFLPSLDSFDMAFSNKEAWEKVDKNWRVGVEHIYSQLKSVFTEYGLEDIGKVGEDFNPEFHQALDTEETENESDDNKVSAVIQKGYKKGTLVLRPAKVKIYQTK